MMTREEAKALVSEIYVMSNAVSSLIEEDFVDTFDISISSIIGKILDPFGREEGLAIFNEIVAETDARIDTYELLLAKPAGTA